MAELRRTEEEHFVFYFLHTVFEPNKSLFLIEFCGHRTYNFVLYSEKCQIKHFLCSNIIHKTSLLAVIGSEGL